MAGPILIGISCKAPVNATTIYSPYGASTFPTSRSIWMIKVLEIALANLSQCLIKTTRSEPETNQAEKRWITRIRGKEIEFMCAFLL